jgi:hypothetical protein
MAGDSIEPSGAHEAFFTDEELTALDADPNAELDPDGVP